MKSGLKFRLFWEEKVSRRLTTRKRVVEDKFVQVHVGVFPDILTINGAEQDDGFSSVFSLTELNPWNAKENSHRMNLISFPSVKLNKI